MYNLYKQKTQLVIRIEHQKRKLNLAVTGANFNALDNSVLKTSKKLDALLNEYNELIRRIEEANAYYSEAAVSCLTNTYKF